MDARSPDGDAMSSHERSTPRSRLATSSSTDRASKDNSPTSGSSRTLARDSWVFHNLRRLEANAMVRLVLAPSEMSVPLYTSLGFRTAHDLMRLDL